MNYQLGIYLFLPKEWEKIIGKIEKQSGFYDIGSWDFTSSANELER